MKVFINKTENPYIIYDGIEYPNVHTPIYSTLSEEVYDACNNVDVFVIENYDQFWCINNVAMATKLFSEKGITVINNIPICHIEFFIVNEDRSIVKYDHIEFMKEGCKYFEKIQKSHVNDFYKLLNHIKK